MLLQHVPFLDKVFFANSGAERVEAAIKFARGATGRPGIVYGGHAYRGPPYGVLSLTDDVNFRGGFCQLLTVPLSKDHKILNQVSGHGSRTIKLLPPLTITDEDCDWIEKAFNSVISDSHKVPGAIWSLGKTLIGNAIRKSA